MRKLVVPLASALILVGAMTSAAAAGPSGSLPASACNDGTMNAHASVPEMTGNGTPIHGHEAIPELDTSGSCSHGG